MEPFVVKHATYVGPNTGGNVTRGMGALTQPHPDKPGAVLAQFDDFHAQRGGVDLAFGWHEFDAGSFALDDAGAASTPQPADRAAVHP